MTRSLVIGAGLGGIAAALRLRAKGDEVEVLEKLPAAGGRAQVFEKNGFKHDAGPTVITAPFLFDELFSLFGEKRQDYLEFKPLDLWYRFYLTRPVIHSITLLVLKKQKKKFLALTEKMWKVMIG